MNKPSFALGNSLIIFASLVMFISVMSLNTGYSNIQGFTTADLAEYTQLPAEINKPVTWIKNDTQQIVETEPPEVVETDTSEVGGKLQKRVTVSSDIHYENILTYASIPDLLPEQVRLFWMIDGVKTDVTEREEFNITFYDEDGDTLIDKISWITPHLSEQEFILEFDITVINPWEYGESGGDWIVYFNTTGTGTLNITKDELSNQVLTFNYIKCGDSTIYSSIGEYSYIIENYSCSEIAEISHTIGEMPSQIFGMQFDFGNDLNNDVDFAYDPDFTADTDSDGIFDADELLLGTDPTNPNDPIYRDATGCSALPFVGPMYGPCTGDGVGADPNNCDEDGDCISDFAESWIAGGGGEYFNAFGVQYNVADTDGGGVNDFDEIVAGTDPTNPGDDGGGGGGGGGGGNNDPVWTNAIDDTVSVLRNEQASTSIDTNLESGSTGHCTDADGDALSFAVQGTCTGMTAIITTVGSTDSITIIPNEDFTGSASCTIRCSDDNIPAGTVDDTFTVTVTNSAPTSATPILNATDKPQNSTNANLTAYNQTFADADGDTLTAIYDWRQQGTSIAVLNAQFDSKYISTAKDYSSYGNDLTVTGADWKNAGTCGLTGSGGCYDLTKVSSTSGDYLYRLTDSDFNGMSAISACLWIKPDSTISDKTFFITKGDAFKLYYQSGIGLRWGLDQAGGYGSATFTGGNWHHVCGTWDTTTDEAKIYHNANLISTDSRVMTTTGSNSEQIRIGAGHQTYYWPMDGLVDGAQIYDVALSADQISSIYNSGTPKYDVLDSELTSNNQNWTVAVTPNDVHGDGTTRTSSTLNINTPPTGSPSIDVSPAYTDSTLNVSKGYSDVNSHSEGSSTYLWWKNDGGGYTSTGVTTSTLGSSNFVKDDQIIAEYTPIESSGLTGISYNSSPLTISNSNPVAVDDSYDVDSGNSVSATNDTVLAKGTDDSDVDTGDTLSVSLASAPSGNASTFSLNSDGTFTYVSDASYTSSTDSFTYTLSDGDGGSDTGTVTLNVARMIAMSISNSFTNNITFEVNETNGSTYSASGNNGASTTGFHINVTGNGSTVNISIKANESLESGSNQIANTNFKYRNSTSNSNVPDSLTANALTTSYVNLITDAAVATAHNIYMKFFLTVPSATAAGNYSNNITIRGQV